MIPGLGSYPGEGNSNPLQYSCLENPVGRGAWQATVHGVTRVGQDLITKPPPPPIKQILQQSKLCKVNGFPVQIKVLYLYLYHIVVK